MAPSRSTIVGALAGILIGGGVVAFATGVGGVGGEEARVEQIVRSYILENPQIIPEAIEKLRSRETAAVVKANRSAIETPFGSAWAGDEKGDVVLVEFFDYACGFCRKSNDDVERLLKEDDNLKVVWRELPVLGPDSQAAAELSLAAAQQGRFRPFYDQLFEAGRPEPSTVEQVRRQVGVAPAPASPAIQAELQKNFELARAINASGTPTFVVGDQVLQGAVGYEALKEAITKARSARS